MVSAGAALTRAGCFKRRSSMATVRVQEVQGLVQNGHVHGFDAGRVKTGNGEKNDNSGNVGKDRRFLALRVPGQQRGAVAEALSALRGSVSAASGSVSAASLRLVSAAVGSALTQRQSALILILR
jgi:hypothetical protein